MPMPNRQITDANGYRYAFQGQENDPETGKEAFELRLWDGRIGRWLTADPKKAGVSPYWGMNNNPILIIDPDGGTGEPVFEGVSFLDDPVIYGGWLAEVFLGNVNGGGSRMLDYNFIKDFPGLQLTLNQSEANIRNYGDLPLNSKERIEWFNRQSQSFQGLYMKQSVANAIGDDGSKIVMAIVGITFAPIAAGELIGLASTSSLFEAGKLAEYQFSQTLETAFYNGAERIILRNATGQFVKGTGSIVPIVEASEAAYYTRIGISGVGSAASAYSIPVVEGSITTMAPIVKIAGSAGLSAAVIYYFAEKEQKKQHNP